MRTGGGRFELYDGHRRTTHTDDSGTFEFRDNGGVYGAGLAVPFEGRSIVFRADPKVDVLHTLRLPLPGGANEGAIAGTVVLDGAPLVGARAKAADATASTAARREYRLESLMRYPGSSATGSKTGCVGVVENVPTGGHFRTP